MGAIVTWLPWLSSPSDNNHPRPLAGAVRVLTSVQPLTTPRFSVEPAHGASLSRAWEQCPHPPKTPTLAAAAVRSTVPNLKRCTHTGHPTTTRLPAVRPSILTSQTQLPQAPGPTLPGESASINVAEGGFISSLDAGAQTNWEEVHSWWLLYSAPVPARIRCTAAWQSCTAAMTYWTHPKSSLRRLGSRPRP
jgi:hypothetical protein